MDARVESDRVLLDHNFLLNQSVDLLLEEVALVCIVDLELAEVFLQVRDIFDDLLENIIRCLRGVVLKCCAF